MGRPAAALRTRRDAGGSIRHACVGIRRLHAHPRGRDLEPDDDDRPQRARSTFRNHAEPIHVEPLPRIAESLVVRKRYHHSLQGKGAQPENLHEQHRPRRRIPHLPVVLRPRRAGHDPVCQPRPGRYGPDLRGLRAVVRRAGRLAGKPEVPATDLVPVARNDGPPAGCRRTAALGRLFGGCREQNFGRRSRPGDRRAFRRIARTIPRRTDRTARQLCLGNIAQTLSRRTLSRNERRPGAARHRDRLGALEPRAADPPRLETAARSAGHEPDARLVRRVVRRLPDRQAGGSGLCESAGRADETGQGVPEIGRKGEHPIRIARRTNVADFSCPGQRPVAGAGRAITKYDGDRLGTDCRAVRQTGPDLGLP